MAADRGPSPSLPTLRALESAARLSSFSKAAAELGVTQGAVSRAIKAIEDWGGVRIFERTGHGLVLTEAGGRFAAQIRTALGEIDRSALELVRYRADGRQLTIATLPTFGSRWLAPRLKRFAARHPNISIDLVTQAQPFDLTRTGVDAAVQFGSEAWPGAICDPLMPVHLVPVLAPALLDRREPTLALIAEAPLLQHRLRPHAWREWLDEAGIDRPGAAQGHMFDSYEAMIEAAKGGLGVALVRTVLVERELTDGSLVALPGPDIRSKESYVLVYPEEKRANPGLQAFRSWLLTEARRSLSSQRQRD